MKVTEKKAESMWCPMSPATEPDGGCLGSKCMMWVWSMVKDQNYGGMSRDLVTTGNMLDCLECVGTGKDSDGDDCMECRGSGKFPELVQLGYCGLARG